MQIIIEINDSELEFKKAIAKGWNQRYNENLTHQDITEVSDKDDILGAIPYLDWDNIEIEVYA